MLLSSSLVPILDVAATPESARITTVTTIIANANETTESASTIIAIGRGRAVRAAATGRGKSTTRSVFVFRS